MDFCFLRRSIDREPHISVELPNSRDLRSILYAIWALALCICVRISVVSVIDVHTAIAVTYSYHEGSSSTGWKEYIQDYKSTPRRWDSTKIDKIELLFTFVPTYI